MRSNSQAPIETLVAAKYRIKALIREYRKAIEGTKAPTSTREFARGALFGYEEAMSLIDGVESKFTKKRGLSRLGQT